MQRKLAAREEQASSAQPTDTVEEVVLAPQERSSYRWVIALLCFLVLLASYTVRIAWGSVATTVGDELSLNSAMLGSFVTAFFAGYVFTNAVSGFIVDRLGAKLVIWVMFIPLGIAVAAFGSLSTPVEGLIVQFCMGLFAGVNHSATSKMVAGWFVPSERGRAFGILVSSSSIALILSNSLFPLFISHFSWRMLYWLLGACVVGLATLNAIMMRDAPSGRRHASSASAREPIVATLKSLLTDRNYLFVALAGFGAQWATWSVIFWTTALLVKGHGFSPIVAGGITAMLGLGGLIAKPTYGLLSDIVPVRRKMMLLPCYLGFAIILIIFSMAHGEGTLRVLAPILGIFTFIYSAPTSALVTEIIGSRNVGAATGLMNAFHQIGAIFAPLAVGVVFQSTGSFFAAFLTMAIGPVFASFSIIMVREPARLRR